MKSRGFIVLAALLTACSSGGDEHSSAAVESRPPVNATATATFAGGCFWCVEAPFEEVPGVGAVVSGYTGGLRENPTYREVSAGGTGHAEAVQVHYDPTVVSYEQLLDVFWRQIDPTDAGGQFVDRGSQYRPEIFYHDEAQQKAALESRAVLEASGRFEEPLATPITALQRFYPAEKYHQDFHVKSPGRYSTYRRGSGRDRYLDNVWGDQREPDWLKTTQGHGPETP